MDKPGFKSYDEIDAAIVILKRMAAARNGELTLSEDKGTRDMQILAVCVEHGLCMMTHFPASGGNRAKTTFRILPKGKVYIE